jgi:hypothetical protein
MAGFDPAIYAESAKSSQSLIDTGRKAGYRRLGEAESLE